MPEKDRPLRHSSLACPGPFSGSRLPICSGSKGNTVCAPFPVLGQPPAAQREDGNG